MGQDSIEKKRRMLGIYTKLMQGSIVNKAEEASAYGVNERSIQRDLDEIRAFLAADAGSSGVCNDVVYDREKKGYRLQRLYQRKLTNSEILAVCKILLDSRAFPKTQMHDVLQKLMDCCVPEADKHLIQDMIRNELFHYIEPRHGTVFVDTMWQLAQAICESRYVSIRYQRLKGQACVERKLMPAAVMFSEYYFYLAAFIDSEETRQHFDVINDSFPTIYRIDRIKHLDVLEERYRIPYKDRFEEGEFRKRVQFMFGGKLQKVTFQYTGLSVEAILDRLPTARIIDEADGIFTITAEVFGNGIQMWLRSQGDQVKILELKNCQV